MSGTSGKILEGQTGEELLAAFPKRRARDPSAVPKITAIKPQVKRAGRYSIFVDDTYAFSLSEGALLDAKIVIGLEVDAEQMAVYKDTSAFDKAYGNTLAYVARRLRSEWELRDYFRRKDIDENDAERIVERLRSYGYVDDLKFAQSWTDNRRAIKNVSRRRIEQELRQKRVPDSVIRQVLEEDEVPDSESLHQLVLKKRTQSRYQDPVKLMQYLARQGFQYDDIKSELQSL